MSDIPKVALLIETSRGFGRGLLRGIVRYAKQHGPWAFYIAPGDLKQSLPKMDQWNGTGIIARVETHAVANAIFESGLPTITLDLSDQQLLSTNPLSRFSEVTVNSDLAAQMAVKHLLERGFRYCAFVGIDGRVWSDRRKEGFIKHVTAAGLKPLVYEPPRLQRDRVWERELGYLVEWLESLPKPVGLMACNDDRGRGVLEACRLAQIQVPEQLAIVGVDDDDLLCELSDPPLSSVALNAEQGGYRAAAALDKMMQGHAWKPERIQVDPLHVVTRRSTNIIAIDDADVAEAIRFIHSKIGSPISTNDVVKHVQISRRALDMRFQNLVGRTIHAEIQRVRLERAKRLLLESDMPVYRVAMAAGFTATSYFSQVFREVVGMPPARYRTQVKAE